MNFPKSTLLALLAFSLATVLPALTQSDTGARWNRPSALLGLGVNHHANSASTAQAVPDAVAMGLASAKVYHFASADFPGAATSLVFDENVTTGTILGDTQFSSPTGFTLHGALYQVFTVPGSVDNETTGINSAGEIVGIYRAVGGDIHGFLDNAGTFTTLDVSGPGTLTEPIDINDSGEIVGIFQDAANVLHGFYTLDSGVSFTVFDVPSATSTLAAGVNSAGAISGVWTDSFSMTHGFLFSGGTFTSFDFPLAKSTTAIGINDSNEIAGYFVDAASVNHGFIYSAGHFTRVDVAGAAGTQLTRIKNKGQVTGLYMDTSTSGESHGLTGR